MPPSIPLPPPTHPPDAAARDLIARIRAYSTVPDGAPAEAHADVIAGLQHLAGEVHGRWLRALALAQGSGTLSHRALSGVTGYSQHRTIQERVYEGRKLLAEDAASAREVG